MTRREKPFIQIAHDLYAWLYGGRMPVRWVLILLVVIRQTVGYRRDHIGDLNLRGLATMVGGEHYYSGRFHKDLRAMERAGIIRLSTPAPRRPGTISYFERDPSRWRPFDARTGVPTTPPLASDGELTGVQATPYKRKKEREGSPRVPRVASLDERLAVVRAAVAGGEPLAVQVALGGNGMIVLSGIEEVAWFSWSEFDRTDVEGLLDSVRESEDS